MCPDSKSFFLPQPYTKTNNLVLVLTANSTQYLSLSLSFSLAKCLLRIVQTKRKAVEYEMHCFTIDSGVSVDLVCLSVNTDA